MNTFISNSEQDTINFAKDFAKTLKKGDIVVLTGELRMWQNKIYPRSLGLFRVRKGNF